MTTRKNITVLDSLVAERIAAGEVIEKPSAVIKELVENSIDAQATQIEITLIDGGKSQIEIIDNGIGFLPNELPLATQRHATSKIKTVEDLENLDSLGFRGEALPSIAAVASLTIISRPREDSKTSQAMSLKLGGIYRTPKIEEVTQGHFLNSSHGSIIRVQNLFSEVPVRLKFLKSASSEISAIRDWLERLSLTQPHIGFTLKSEGKILLELRPGTIENRILELFDETNPKQLVSSELIEQGLKLKAYWLQGRSLSNTRGIIQMINSRSVRDRLVQQALLHGFKQLLLPGQFPCFLLQIEIDPKNLDVNIHPEKTEVRFINSGRVFKAIEKLVAQLLGYHGAPTWAPSVRKTTPNTAAFEFNTHEQVTSYNTQNLNILTNQNPDALASQGLENNQTIQPTKLPDFLYQSKFNGILFNTYLVYDNGSEMILIDQHAAHERIRFEKLKKQALEANLDYSSQPLLIPEVVSYHDENTSLVTEKLWILQRMGFDVEVFGDHKLIFRALPSIYGTDELRPRLQNLVEKLVDLEPGKDHILDEKLFEKLASEACHSAIRARDRLSVEKSEYLIKELFQCEHPWNCPHGRPTVARIPETRLEEWFQRKAPKSELQF